MENEIIINEKHAVEIEKPAMTMDDRLKIFNAVNNAQSLEDLINTRTTISVSNVIIQPVETVDRATGEQLQRNRIVLICEDGAAYGCMSTGVETALRNLFAIVGNPDEWEHAITMRPVKLQGKNGFKFTTLELA